MVELLLRLPWRLFLLLVAFYIAADSIHEFSAWRSHSSESSRISLEELQRLGREAPKYVRVPVRDVPLRGICFETVLGEGNQLSTDIYAPMLTRAQYRELELGKPVVATVVYRRSTCEPNQVEEIAGTIESRHIDIVKGVREEFRKEGIQISNNAVQLTDGDLPSPWSAVGWLAFALFIGACAIISLKPGKTIDEDQLYTLATTNAFHVLHPAARLGETVTGPNGTGVGAAILARHPERVIAAFNCRLNLTRALVVFTNQRLLIYRFGGLRFLNFLSFVQKLLGKVPTVGGLLSGIFEPVTETYEVLFKSRDRLYERTIGIPDHRLISGDVPWRARTDLTWDSFARRVKDVCVLTRWRPGVTCTKRGWFTKGAPPDLFFDETEIRVGVAKLLEDAWFALESLGVTITQTAGVIITIDVPEPADVIDGEASTSDATGGYTTTGA